MYNHQWTQTLFLIRTFKRSFLFDFIPSQHYVLDIFSLLKIIMGWVRKNKCFWLRMSECALCSRGALKVLLGLLLRELERNRVSSGHLKRASKDLKWFKWFELEWDFHRLIKMHYVLVIQFWRLLGFFYFAVTLTFSFCFH